MLFWVCECACVPLVCVMVVGEGCSGLCCFQYCVAVVSASRRVPGVGVCVCVLVCSGVGWLVPGVGGLVWACCGVGWLVSGVCGVCAGVVWLVLVGVCWLVGVLWWFRMLTCLASFFFLGFVFCFVSCLVNNGLPGCVGAGGCLLVGCLGWCGRVLWLVGGWLCLLLCVGGWVCFVVGWKCVCLLLVGYWVVVACVLVSRGVRVGLLVVVLLVRECGCWCLVVSVVVWVWGVLLLVAFCLCGFVTVLLRVV